MSKKIVIDMMKCRSCSSCQVQCSYQHHPGNNGMMPLLERAAFTFTCRRCEDAPCIEVCPVDAMEKDDKGIISRSSILCVACKSCVMACPFGTMMNNFFEVRRSVCDYCGLNGSDVKLLCIESCPNEALAIVDSDEDPGQNLHKLNEKVLVREILWDNLKHD